jgi:hypothetical protein
MDTGLLIDEMQDADQNIVDGEYRPRLGICGFAVCLSSRK